MARLILSLLGTFEAAIDKQPITHFRSTNNQGLLVYLALHSANSLPRELLAAVFWPEEPEQIARNNLRQALFRLRQMLGERDDPERPYLLVTRQTVQFNPDSDFVLDVQQFLRAVDDGDLETAVSHYTGDLLPGFTCDSLEFESWLRQEREHLHYLALEAMTELVRDYLSNGRFAEAQTVARQQLALEPWREQAHRQLMQAFALGGDRGNALAQFELCRKALAAELDIEPAEETARLYDDIKAGRYGGAATSEPVQPPVKVRHNLPADTTPLIGRELERAQINQRLTKNEQRLVTILGPGGIGKTRLALAVAAEMLDQYQDGVYFVDLAPLGHPDEIGQAIAAALDYQAPDKTQALFPQLLKTISRQNLLLILDNFEHLLDGSLLVNALLQACPQVAILATSRQRLNLAGESRFELGGLEFPDWLTPEDALDYTAVQLFVENGRRAHTDFVITAGNVADVVRICQLVQGMPLGLVLAASWLALLTPAEIAHEIENSLDFLAADLADLPMRQRSVQAIFDYSWQMLTPVEQAVLARLSVFRGGFTREAAEEVAAANLRVLLALVNKSLVQRQVENGRFTLHELLRQFAAQQRRQIEANNETLHTHCHYFAQVIKANAEPVDQLYEWITQYSADRDNLFRAWEFALGHQLAEEMLDLLPGIHTFNLRQAVPSYPLIIDAIQALQDHGYTDTDEVMLRLQIWAQFARWGFDDAHEILTQLKNFIPILQNAANFNLLKDIYWGIGFVKGELDDPESDAYFEKAYEINLAMGEEIPIKIIEAHRLFYRVELGLQDEETAAQLEELLAYFAPQYAKSEIFHRLLLVLTRVMRAEKAYAQAIDYGQRSLALSQHWQQVWAIGASLYELAQTYTAMGLPDVAKQQHLSALEWHLAVAQDWQTLGQLYGQAVSIPEWIGGQATAVAIFSMITHHNDVAVYHQLLIEAALPQIKAEMGEAAFAAAWEKGREMELDTAVSLIRLALSGV